MAYNQRDFLEIFILSINRSQVQLHVRWNPPIGEYPVWHSILHALTTSSTSYHNFHTLKALESIHDERYTM